jgi:hypothetical protein
LVRAISPALPKPFSTTTDPASASARAMPSPMPLVEPVISETLPARDPKTGAVCAAFAFDWMFMQILSLETSAPHRRLSLDEICPAAGIYGNAHWLPNP